MAMERESVYLRIQGSSSFAAVLFRWVSVGMVQPEYYLHQGMTILEREFRDRSISFVLSVVKIKQKRCLSLDAVTAVT